MVFEKVRHTYVGSPYSSSTYQIPKLLFKQKKMRTFILDRNGYLSSLEPRYLSSSDYDDILSNFRFLRSLSLRIGNVKTLPSRLGKLIHLRYLDLSQNKYIKEVPNSITGLYNLQTLLLCDCYSLVSLPRDVQNLMNLRDLDLSNCLSLTHMPCGIGEMTSLQTLSTFVVAQNESSESGGLGELSKLKNLRGRLTIKILGLGESGDVQYLKDKENLESFHWNLGEKIGNAEEAFKRLEPHQNIKSIQMQYYLGEAFPNWLSLLTNLVYLNLSDCKECKYLPPLHLLCSLQELIMENLSALEYVSTERNREWDRDDHLSTSSKSSTMSTLFFPSLRGLVIRGCANLKGWWVDRSDKSVTESQQQQQQQQEPSFPNLTFLSIHGCPLLTSMPLFPNLKDLFLCNTSSKPLQETSMMTTDSSVLAATSSSASCSSSSSSWPSALSNLNYLSIIRVDDLESLLPEAIYNLSSLQTLRICYCSNLASLPEGISNLKSLQELQISTCKNFTSLPGGIWSLSSLTNLIIIECRKLTSIPNEIGSLPSLERVNGRPCSEIPMNALADYLLRENNPA